MGMSKKENDGNGKWNGIEKKEKERKGKKRKERKGKEHTPK